MQSSHAPFRPSTLSATVGSVSSGVFAPAAKTPLGAPRGGRHSTDMLDHAVLSINPSSRKDEATGPRPTLEPIRAIALTSPALIDLPRRKTTHRPYFSFGMHYGNPVSDFINGVEVITTHVLDGSSEYWQTNRYSSAQKTRGLPA